MASWQLKLLYDGQGPICRREVQWLKNRDRAGRLYGVWTIEMADGEPSLPTLVADDPEKAYVSPAFSGDGRQLAFAAWPPEGAGRIDIFTVSEGFDFRIGHTHSP